MFGVLDITYIIYKSQNVLGDWKPYILEIDVLCWLALIQPVSFFCYIVQHVLKLAMEQV